MYLPWTVQPGAGMLAFQLVIARSRAVRSLRSKV
jgi:hypothetical protein